MHFKQFNFRSTCFFILDNYYMTHWHSFCARENLTGVPHNFSIREIVTTDSISIGFGGYRWSL